MGIPRDQPAFHKWDPDGHDAKARAAARHIIDGKTPEAADRAAGRHTADPLAGKKWILRWAWALSTGVLLFGYLVIVLVLTGNTEWLGR